MAQEWHAATSHPMDLAPLLLWFKKLSSFSGYTGAGSGGQSYQLLDS